MIRTLLYKDGKLETKENEFKIRNMIKNGAMAWIDVNNATEEELDDIAKEFKLHPLALKDCRNKRQRAKIDDYGTYYFMILNVIMEKKRTILHKEEYVFMGENYIITFSWDSSNIMDEQFERMSEKAQLFERGIDFILYNILDAITDAYMPVMDRIGTYIDELEERILNNPIKTIQQEIIGYKRRLISLKRLLSPQRDAVNIMLRHEYTLITEKSRMYYMDVYDHILRMFELVDTYEEILSGTMDLYMSEISNKTNDIMKILTIMSTIIMPLTLISGIYGMNFVNMPELGTKYGYFITIGVMAVIVIAEIHYFKHKKWL